MLTIYLRHVNYLPVQKRVQAKRTGHCLSRESRKYFLEEMLNGLSERREDLSRN